MRDLGYDTWTVSPEAQIVLLCIVLFAVLVLTASKLAGRLALTGTVNKGILGALQFLQVVALMLGYWSMWLVLILPRPMGQLQGCAFALYFLSLFVCFPIAWWYYGRGKQASALLITILPFLWLVTLVIGIVVVICLHDAGIFVPSAATN